MGFSFKKLWEKATPQDEEAQRRANANLQRATRQLASTPAKYGVMRNPAVQQQFVRQQSQPVKFNTFQAAKQSFPTATKQVSAGLGLRAARTGVGLAQGVSGLYDLATPGVGTNRLSKGLHSTAKDIDYTAKMQGGGAKFAYDTSAPVMEVASFLAGGGIIKAAGKLPSVAKVVAKGGQVTKPVTTAVSRMDAGAKKTAAKALTNPANVANMGIDASYSLGQEASRGRDISKGDVALAVGASAGLGVGLPVVANKLSRGVKVNTGGAKSTTKKTNDLVSHEGAPDRARVDFYKKQIADGKKVQPIKIINEGNKYGIEDGKHRYQAMKEMGVKNIPTREVNTNGKFIKPTVTPKPSKLQPLNQTGGASVDGPVIPTGLLAKGARRLLGRPQASLKQNPSGSSTGSIPPDATPPISKADERIASAKNAGKENKVSKWWKLKENVDPNVFAYKMDKLIAKKMGMRVDEVPRNLSVRQLQQRFLSAGSAAKAKLENAAVGGTPLRGIFQKYGNQTEKFNDYRYALADLERRADGRAPIRGQVPDDELEATIRSFESSNPGARKDAMLVSQFHVQEQQRVVGNGFSDDAFDNIITKQDGTPYQHYAYYERVKPKDERATVDFGRSSSQSSQKTIKNQSQTEGDVDLSMEPLLRFQTKVEQDVAKYEMNKLIADNADIMEPFMKMTQSGAMMRGKDKLLTQAEEALNAAKAAQKELNKMRQKMRLAKKDVTIAGQKAKTENIRSSKNQQIAEAVADGRARLDSYKLDVKTKAAINDMVAAIKNVAASGRKAIEAGIPKGDVDAIAALRGLSDTEVADLMALTDRQFGKLAKKDAKLTNLKTAAESARTKAPRVTRSASKSEIRTAEKFAQRSEAHGRLVDSVSNLRDNIKTLKNESSTARKEAAEIQPEWVDGALTYSILEPDGYVTKFAVTDPRAQRFLQGVPARDAGDVVRFLRRITEIPKATITGPLAPVFNLVQGVAGFGAASLARPAILNPRNLPSFFKALNKNSELVKSLDKKGVAGFSQRFQRINAEEFAESYAKSGLDAEITYLTKNPGRVLDRIDFITATFDKLQRRAVANAAYQSRLRKNGTKAEAEADAAYAFENDVPNYMMVGPAVKAIDAIALTYFAPSVAGTKTLASAIRNRPESRVALAAAGTILGGLWYHAQADEKYEEYVRTTEEAGRAYDLDNNIHLLFDAKYNKDTGEWSGVIKIPLSPELRGINKAVRGATDLAGSKAYSNTASMRNIAMGMSNFVTGGLTETLSSPGRAVTSNMIAKPIINAVAGRDISNPNYEPYRQPGNTAKENLYNTLNATAGGFGITGKLAQTQLDKAFGVEKPRNVGNVYKDQEKRFTTQKTAPGYGRELAEQRKDVAELGLNKQQIDDYNANFNVSKKDRFGNKVVDKTYYDSAQRAVTLRESLQGDGKVYEMRKRVNDRAKAEGKPGDPFFDEPLEHQMVILQLQSTPTKSKEDKAIAILNPWLPEYYRKSSARYDDIKATLKPEDQKKFGIDPKGIKLPTASPSVQARLDFADTIKDPKEKAKIYREEDVADHLADSMSYERQKRDNLALPQFDQYPTPTPQVQKYMDAYSALPKGDGKMKKDGTRSSPSRSAWIKAHPNEWAAMSTAFDKIAEWTTADDGSVAVYEGIDKNANLEGSPEAAAQNAIDAAEKGATQYSSFLGGYEDKKTSSQNPLKYAISLNAGGKTKTPTVKKTKIAKTYVAGKTRPKVTMKTRKARV